jgi:hypothetical protein
MHVYPQSREHEDSIIVGNKEALLNLRNAIDKALEEKQGIASSFTRDGEEYYTVVICDNVDNLTFPYSVSNPEYKFTERSNPVPPYMLIDMVAYREYHDSSGD